MAQGCSMLSEVNTNPCEAYSFQWRNQVSYLTENEEEMGATRVYVETVKGRRLRDALDSWGSSRFDLYPDVPGACSVLPLDSVQGLLRVYHGSTHAILDAVEVWGMEAGRMGIDWILV